MIRLVVVLSSLFLGMVAGYALPKPRKEFILSRKFDGQREFLSGFNSQGIPIYSLDVSESLLFTISEASKIISLFGLNGDLSISSKNNLPRDFVSENVENYG